MKISDSKNCFYVLIVREFQKKKMDCSLRFAIPYFAPGDLLSSATLRVANMVRTLGNIFGFGWSKLLENVLKR